jgi:5-methylcytosine-specific restriction protein A
MAKEYAKSFYNGKQWKQCREGYIKSVNGLCEPCLVKGKIVNGKIVHHKEYITPDNINDSSITLNWANLEYYCQDCHNQEHHGVIESAVRDDVMFDEQGNLIARG